MRRAWEHVKVGPFPSRSTVNPNMTWLPQIDRVTWLPAQRINHSTPAGPRKGSSGREEHEKVGPGSCEAASGFDFTYTPMTLAYLDLLDLATLRDLTFQRRNVRSGILYFLLPYFVFWRWLNALRGHHVSCGTVFSTENQCTSSSNYSVYPKKKKRFCWRNLWLYVLSNYNFLV